jgi:hypothetical protein
MTKRQDLLRQYLAELLREGIRPHDEAQLLLHVHEDLVHLVRIAEVLAPLMKRSRKEKPT